jgi:type I restriction enzyme M protein
MTSPLELAPLITIAGSVPEGKRIDFLTGRVVNDTPEEYVRQNIEKGLVRQYRFDPLDCEPEYGIRVGSSRRRVDIAIFLADQPHAQHNIYIVVETKRSGISKSSKTEGVGQLESYLAACLNAKYGIWTNGEDRICLAKRHDINGSFRIEEILDIPACGQTEEDAQRPHRRDLRPATADNLLFAFRRCHNYIAANEGKQKPEAFSELLKLIFCKIEDERSNTLNFYVTAAERETATSAVSAKARIDAIFRKRVIRKYPTIFAGIDPEIDLKSSVVAYVVSQLQNISLLLSPVDVKGVAYEEIVGSNLRGDRGEFFTPRNACRMAVNMLNPQPDERIIDPASGTGGFLITAMNHALDFIKLEHEKRWQSTDHPTEEEREEHWRARQEYLRTKLYGMDLNPALVRAAKMNMVMNNDGSGSLWQANSLANPHTWVPDLAGRTRLGSFHVVVTNPPFGTNIRIDDQDVLSQYDLARVWDFDTASGTWSMRSDRYGRPIFQRSQPPEILFIERCVQLLQDGGRMAIVLPNGILNNPALGYVRQWIRLNTQLLAIVDMARELFQPKNDTQTSMVLLRKLSQHERAIFASGGVDYPVFMAIAEKIGKDRRGNAIYKRDEVGDDVLAIHTDTFVEIDQDGREIYREVHVKERLVDDDLDDVAVAYRRWLADHQ